MNELSDGADLLAPQNDRRDLLQRMCALAAVGMASGTTVLTSCGGGGGGGGAAVVPAASPSGSASVAAGPAPATATAAPPSPATPPASTPASGPPALGAHGINFHFVGTSAASLPVSGLSTRASGSSLLVCVGRGDQSASGAPTDNQGNVFAQRDTAHAYTLYPTSGTALFACEKARGAAGHTVAAPKPAPQDEVTVSVVEITAGGLVRDVKWREVLVGQPITSASVTITGPALLVAWWWGDAGVLNDKTAVPDNGFTVIDSVLAAGALVQCAVAVKQVDAAGSYNVTWTATPPQGAQLWLAAVQTG